MSSPSRAQIIAVSLELCLFGVVTYFGIKWLMAALDPTYKQKQAARKQAEKMMKSLGINSSIELSEYEMSIAAHLVDPLNLPISWSDIGGLQSIVTEIKESVIMPFKFKSYFNDSTLLSAPKGVLLYGPPGCGKTMIAKATAKEAGCRFINLDISSLTDKWYGESQKLANAVFSLAYKLQPCIIFIDEIDSFLRSRDSHDHEATAMMKAQFMSLWDGLASAPSVEVIVMGATNRPQDVDKAILRRMPCRFNISLPDQLQRLAILKIILRNECLSADVSLPDIASLSEGYSGSDLKELCRLAALQRLHSQMRELNEDPNQISSGLRLQLESIQMEDFMDALRRMSMNHSIMTLIE